MPAEKDPLPDRPLLDLVDLRQFEVFKAAVSDVQHAAFKARISKEDALR